MQGYIVRRLILAIPTFFIATSLVFMMVRLVPGDIMLTILEESLVSELSKDVAQLKAELGLDRPIHEQYVSFIGGLFRGDLGLTLRDRQSVLDLILTRLPVTFELAILAQTWAIVLAIPIGVISAIRQDTALDYITRSFAILGISLPSFWLATLAVTLPAIWFRWIPPIVYVPFFDDPLKNIQQFLIPAFILGLLLSGRLMRITRTMMLEVMRQDYIRTAWAKGLSERMVIYRHALKNALIPVVTIAGLEIVGLIGGSVVIENIFAIPGMGQLFIQALTWRDYPIIQGINVIVVTWVILVNLLVDLSYARLDPRVRYS